MIKTKLSILAFAFLSLVNNAKASSTSANFESIATLNGSCVVFTDNINFGSITYSATGSATLQGNISAICSKGGGGLGAVGTYGNSNTQQFPVFVKIQLNHNIKHDTYSDTLVVTLMY